MTFYEHFISLPKEQKVIFRDKITEETGKSQQTFYYWIRKKKVAGILVRKKIALIMNFDIQELFPNQNNR